MIEFDHVTVTYAEAASPGAARREPARSTRASWPWWWAGPAWASPPCSAPSTGWCPTSPAARWPAGCSSTAATPAPTAARAGRRGRAWSARTRCRASSPTPSRRSWPTAWSSWPSPPDVMRKRVEETLDLLGIAELRDRALHELSGGQQQRVAIGSVLTAHPRVLVLDEPTSALDPTAAEEVLAAITRLVHDLGVTVVLAEHRLERVVQYADRVVEVAADGTVAAGPPAAMLATAAVAPPVVELGRLAGWDPLPLSVRDARRLAGPLRDRHRRAGRCRRRAGRSPGGRRGHRAGGAQRRGPLRRRRRRPRRRPRPGRRRGHRPDGPQRVGQVLAAVGAAGVGPPPGRARWTSAGADPRSLPPARARRLVGLVPQTPGRPALPRHRGRGVRPGRPGVGGRAGDRRPAQLLDRLAPGIPDDVHPRDLSEGQRLALVLAVQLAAAPGGGAARRAHPGPRLPGQAVAHRHRRPAGRRGPGGGRRHPRRRVRGGRRPTGWW